MSEQRNPKAPHENEKGGIREGLKPKKLGKQRRSSGSPSGKKDQAFMMIVGLNCYMIGE